MSMDTVTNSFVCVCVCLVCQPCAHGSLSDKIYPIINIQCVVLQLNFEYNLICILFVYTRAYVVYEYIVLCIYHTFIVSHSVWFNYSTRFSLHTYPETKSRLFFLCSYLLYAYEYVYILVCVSSLAGRYPKPSHPSHYNNPAIFLFFPIYTFVLFHILYIINKVPCGVDARPPKPSKPSIFLFMWPILFHFGEK